MVSLQNSKGHEGSFGEENESPEPPLFDSAVNDTESLIPSSQVASFYSAHHHVKRFPGVFVIVLQILLLIGFEVCMFVLNDVIHTVVLGGITPPFALLTTIQVGVWALVCVIDRYLHYHHHMLRKYGYLNFFTKTKDLRRVPVIIMSIGNAALLVIASFVGSDRDMVAISLVRIFQIIGSIEVATCLVVTFVYIRLVLKFNAEKNLPDVFHQDLMGGFHSNVYDSNEIGYRDNEGLDDILEKQAEMIRYLQQHNTNLGKRIVEIMKLVPKDQQSRVNTSHLMAHQISIVPRRT